MNKTDRMLAIVLELQRKGMLRGEDLAAVFETSVRTIYRDMQALSEAGVPIVGSPGQGYSLVEGYFLPPVSFTADEAVTLLIGADFVEQRFDGGYGHQAQAARRKIEAILPEEVRRDASRLRTTVKLLAVERSVSGGKEREGLKLLRQAILERRKVSFGYSGSSPDADGNRPSERVAAPYGLVFVQGTWMLIAYCELRQELRHFRLSRMARLALLEEKFAYPPDFDLQKYVPKDDRTVRVLIQVQTELADKVKESNNYYMDGVEEHPDGLRVTFRVRHPEDVLQWILGWGAGVLVLEPESLRHRVREEAEKIQKRY